jgi:hypothetical protein
VAVRELKLVTIEKQSKTLSIELPVRVYQWDIIRSITCSILTISDDAAIFLMAY